MAKISPMLLAVLLAAGAGPSRAAEKARDPASPWDVRPAMVGSTIPKVTLLTAEGMEFDLNRSVASMPTILIFYRGGW